jgi:hypothetical protein
LRQNIDALRKRIRFVDSRLAAEAEPAAGDRRCSRGAGTGDRTSLLHPDRLGLHVNLTTTCLTAVGKDHPPERVKQALREAGLDAVIAPGAAYTVSSLEQILIDRPVCLSIADQVGEGLLARMLAKKASADQRGMKGLLQSLHSKASAASRSCSSARSELTTRGRRKSKTVNGPEGAGLSFEDFVSVAVGLLACRRSARVLGL